MIIKCRAKAFKTYDEAEAYAEYHGGVAMSMPYGEAAVVSEHHADRIDTVGGPETAVFVGRRQRGGIRTIEAGYYR